MIHRVRSGALGLGLLTCLIATEPVRAGDAVPSPSRPFEQSLRDLKIGAGIVNEEVILFPLYAPAEPATAEESFGAGAVLVFSEPDPKAGKPTVVATNDGAAPALALAGTVIEGGRRDRMVRFDRLIPAKSVADVEVLPASTSHDARAKGSEFQNADFLAPSYLREGAQFSADPSLVPRFVSHFFEFRNANDKRESLLAIAGSDALAGFCLTCQRSFSDWPTKKGAGTAVGAILVVRGRVQSLEVFASNADLRAFLPPLLKGLAFPAAAIALRAKRLNVPLPWSEDPVGTLAAATKASEELLANVATAKFSERKTDPAFLGEAWVVHLKDDARGSALTRDGRLVHASVYPGDPFEVALYAHPLNPLDPRDNSGGSGPGGDIGRAELERLAARGMRLTPAELRLLERMRERLPIVR